MIRPATLICSLIAFGSGLYLYQTKHGAQLLDREIARTVHDTGAANDRIKTLQAEWLMLNEPERLQGLASQYLALRPMAPTQVASATELATRLPAPLPASAFAPPGVEEPLVAATLPAPGPAAAPAIALPAAIAAAAPRPARPAAPAAAVASVAFPPTPALLAAAIPLPPRTVVERVADRTVTDRTSVEHAADDRQNTDPASHATRRRMPDAAITRLTPPVAIGSAVAAPLAPAIPPAPRPAIVQRIATAVPRAAPALAPRLRPRFRAVLCPGPNPGVRVRHQRGVVPVHPAGRDVLARHGVALAPAAARPGALIPA